MLENGLLRLGDLAFASPLLLALLALLPILWWLLRATPPAPRRQAFPGVKVLLDLDQEERAPEHTPWWVLLLRILAAGLAILAFSQPLWNARPALTGDGPLRLVFDGGWASAPDWAARQAAALEVLAQAGRAERPVEVVNLSAPHTEEGYETRPAADWRDAVAAMTPAPWAPDRSRTADLEPRETVWISDGLSHDSGALPDPARVFAPETPAQGLRLTDSSGAALVAEVIRSAPSGAQTVRVGAYAADEAGARGQRLASADAAFAADALTAQAEFTLPVELRNRVAYVAIEGQDSAGAVVALDSRWRRKRVGLASSESAEDSLRLLSGAYYVDQAAAPVAELRRGALADLTTAESLESLDALILLDIGAIPPAQSDAILAWVRGGGVLVRFAGSQLAARLTDQANGRRAPLDPLSPVRLRPGGRDLGGAMSWGAPQKLAPFPPHSPFAGLDIPDEVEVTRQVLAEPDADLTQRTWARLGDGAPLVTARAEGDGRLALFHVGAAPRWSTLPLSGLFVQMLDRILNEAGSSAAAPTLQDALWEAQFTLNGFGAPDGPEMSVMGTDLAPGIASAQTPPGLYQTGRDLGQEPAVFALNVIGEDQILTPMAAPDGAVVEVLGARREWALKPMLLVAAFALLLIDALAALWLAGRLSMRRGAATAAAVALVGLILTTAPQAHAQTEDAALADPKAITAALDVSLAYVLTGDSDTDSLTERGMIGVTWYATQVANLYLGKPVGVNLETDDLSVYPLIYWAVAPDQPAPSDVASAKLNTYMRRGGMLIMDARDQNLAVGGSTTPGLRTVRRLTTGLDVPAMEPLPDNHVLTRSYYLLRGQAPGRWTGGAVWVAVSPPPPSDDERPEGFKNDGVTPIVIGARDWIGAWAIDDSRRSLLPVEGRGFDSPQRRRAFWFGANLIMHALTGAYKSDQVHIPELIERLRQE